MRKLATWAIVALLPIAALLWFGRPASAGDVSIADIVAHPDAYDGATVTVLGTVEVALPAGAESGYDLRDGAWKLSVISPSSAPRVGARLLVTGTIRRFTEGEATEANEYPPVLVESARAPAP